MHLRQGLEVSHTTGYRAPATPPLSQKAKPRPQRSRASRLAPAAAGQRYEVDRRPPWLRVERNEVDVHPWGDRHPVVGERNEVDRRLEWHLLWIEREELNRRIGRQRLGVSATRLIVASGGSGCGSQRYEVNARQLHV